MEKETIRAVLPFIGGLLAFAAALIPLIVRFWDYTGGRLLPYLPTIILLICIVAIVVWILVEVNRDRLAKVITLLKVYLLLMLVEFSLRPWGLIRWEIGLLILNVVITLEAIASMSSNIKWQTFVDRYLKSRA